jgi:ABC-type bacteriocin/lantibiotic exporter with double-glycine peptidase domain
MRFADPDEGRVLVDGQDVRSVSIASLRSQTILVLDEAAAMFDPEGERAFIAECQAALAQRTVILITHRPASLALADRVLPVDKGRISDTIPRCTGAPTDSGAVESPLP